MPRRINKQFKENYNWHHSMRRQSDTAQQNWAGTEVIYYSHTHTNIYIYIGQPKYNNMVQ